MNVRFCWHYKPFPFLFPLKTAVHQLLGRRVCECGDLIFSEGTVGNWDCEKWIFRPIFVPLTQPHTLR